MFLTVDHEKKVVIFLVYSSPNGENVQRMYKQRSLLFSSFRDREERARGVIIKLKIFERTGRG